MVPVVFNALVVLYNKSLNDWSLRNQLILFSSILDLSRETLRFEGNKINCFPPDQLVNLIPKCLSSEKTSGKIDHVLQSDLSMKIPRCKSRQPFSPFLCTPVNA